MNHKLRYCMIVLFLFIVISGYVLQTQGIISEGSFSLILVASAIVFVSLSFAFESGWINFDKKQ